MSQTANQPVYKYIKGLGYLPIDENELEKYVPELGFALDLACIELSTANVCPMNNHQLEFEKNGSCSENCGDKEIRQCWKEYFQQKVKESAKK